MPDTSPSQLKTCTRLLVGAFESPTITLDNREVLIDVLGRSLASIRVSLRCGRALLQTSNLLLPGTITLSVCALTNSLAARAIQVRRPITFTPPNGPAPRTNATTPKLSSNQGLVVVCAPAMLLPSQQDAHHISPVGVGAILLGFHGSSVPRHIKSRILALAETLAPFLASIALPKVEYLVPLLHVEHGVDMELITGRKSLEMSESTRGEQQKQQENVKLASVAEEEEQVEEVVPTRVLCGGITGLCRASSRELNMVFPNM